MMGIKEGLIPCSIKLLIKSLKSKGSGINMPLKFNEQLAELWIKANYYKI